MLQATSIHAYESIRGELNDREKAVKTVLFVHGPQTLFEIAARLGVQDHSVSGRLTRMADYHQIIERTGERRMNPKTGRNADVWRLKKYEPPAPNPEHKPASLFG